MCAGNPGVWIKGVPLSGFRVAAGGYSSLYVSNLALGARKVPDSHKRYN
ncbi:hypothetical protein MmTuc01_2678 [Methanosarcina mazei Tuc01]|uniref:Uncharacterized protein n=1 Tax=Methanosarcina mazei Tuc01 TaxID=1236903 RepID=M1QCM0_METMZ|nr:hypothetical protein MmTuc01_2678 [Methanosarcina mazei Tuc01]